MQAINEQDQNISLSNNFKVKIVLSWSLPKQITQCVTKQPNIQIVVSNKMHKTVVSMTMLTC